MKIETKFEIGNEVYFMKDNKIHCSCVDSIQIISRDKDSANEYYYVWGMNKKIHASRLFRHRDDLIEHLCIGMERCDLPF